MADKKIVGWNIFYELEDEEGNLTLEAWNISNYIANLIDEDFAELLQSQSFEAESKTLDYTGNFSGSHDGVDYDVSYECSHDIDNSYEAEIRDYVEAKISNGYDSGYESFEMSTGFYEGEIEIEGTVTWESSETFDAPTGYTEMGPRPFYGNPRKMALDRWGNRRFIRRRKDGT